jgi:hypothetical protein
MATREDYDIVLRATDQTQGAFASAQRGAQGLNSAVGMMKATLGALGLAISGAEIVAFTKEAVASLADIGSSAKRVDATTDALQVLRFEVRQGGGDIKDADTFLQRFAESASKAATDGNFLTKVFQTNNIALRDQTGRLKNSTDLLQEYARLVANATSHEDKLRLAREAGGKGSGEQMLEVLEKIAREGYPSVIARAKELGVVIDKNLIDKADEVDKKWKQSSDRMIAYFKGVSIAAIDAVQDFVDKATIAEALDKGTASLRQLQIAIAMARKAGSPIDPSWIAQMERLMELQRERNKGKFPEFSGEAKPTFVPNVAMEEATDALNKHVAALKSAAESIDASAGEQEKLRVKTELLATAHKAGAGVAEQYRAKIEAMAESFGEATDFLERMKIDSSIDFSRQTAFLLPEDVRIARELKGIYGNDIPAALASSKAEAMRLNNALADISNTGRDTLKGFTSDVRQFTRAGETGWQAVGHAALNQLDKITDKMNSMIIDNLWAKIFGGGSGFNILSLLSGGGGGGGGMPGPDGLGFEPGGYTGAIGRKRIAGFVHGEEFVVNAEATARYRGLLEAINASPMRGYELGGYVDSPASFAAAPVRDWTAAGPAFSIGRAAPRAIIEVGVSVDDDGRLRAIARDAGREGAADAADVRVRAFSKSELPYRVRDIDRQPRKIG